MGEHGEGKWSCIGLDMEIRSSQSDSVSDWGRGGRDCTK